MRYNVTSNAAAGFDGMFRGTGEGKDWFWPKTGIEIEVTDDQDDPVKQPEDGPRTIGQRTWKALQDDPRIFAGPVGADDGTTSAALAAANGRIAELEKLLAEAQASATSGKRR